MTKYLPLIHRIVVSLFLLIYLLKTILLLINKHEALKKFTKVVKIPEMIISLLFLMTGIWLTAIFGASTFTIIKIILVLSSIPIAVIGFKKKNKMLALASLLLIVLSYGLGEMSKNKREKTIVVSTATESKQLFEEACSSCHGNDGKLMMGGASDLSVSTLSRDSIITVISKGRNNNKMMAYGEKYSKEQIEQLAAYIETLKGK
ncbi:MAG: c-type cytochrome [Bacteroidota bacterium]|jgi:cytochrome c553